MSNDSETQILIIEDSPTQAIRLQMVLEAEGFATVVADSAEKALALFAEVRPDLVIVDYHLPGIQGDEFCRQLRMNINTQSIPILMLTMDQTAAAELHGLQSGADDYVSKSEDTDILMLRVHALLRKSRQRSSVIEGDVSLYHRARILVVDDSETYLTFVEEQLAQEGYEVVTATTGADALGLMRGQSFDLVLVDLVMPGMDGVALCHELAASRATGELPVVILMISAHEGKENVTRALEAGADDFVGKSSDFAVVKARVRALLRRKFFLEQNRRILEEFKAKEMEMLRARAEKEAAEARAALAEELRQANHELEAANRRLRETQIQLVHSEKMASLGQLVAGIAHEINNPLSFVVSHVYSMDKWLEEVAERDREALSEQSLRRLRKASARISDIVQGLDRVKNLVVKLRSFSRLDEDEWTSLDVHDAIETVLLFLHYRIKDRIKVVRDYRADRELPCRSGQINQVLMNIVANAVEAIEDEGTVTIATAVRDGAFEITVSDTGQGFPEEVRQKLFDPFFTTKPVGQGTGLGLAISYGIVRAHQGSIDFDSVEGKGTTVTIRLPLDIPETKGDLPLADVQPSPDEKRDEQP